MTIQHPSVQRGVALATAVLLASLLAARPAHAADSLYQRLGGYDAIAEFVDTAFPRVAQDPQLVHLFRGHSVSSQMKQRQLIVDALCAATGGPCIYTGREMKPLHMGLQITNAQWKAFMTIISQAAVENKLGAPERKEFLEMFNSRFKPDIVQAP